MTLGIRYTLSLDENHERLDLKFNCLNDLNFLALIWVHVFFW